MKNQKPKNGDGAAASRTSFFLGRLLRLLPFAVLLLILLCAVLSFAGRSYTERLAGQLEIAFLDVGQGDATLLILPDGGVVLIDCAEADHADAVCRALLRRDLRRVDHLILTHPHSDHIGGGEQLCERFEVGNIWRSETEGESFELSALLFAAERQGSALHTLAADDRLPTGAVSVEVLSPPAGVNAGGNNDSVVLLITYGKIRFLLMADAEAEAEEGIRCGRVDLLRIGHHGSETSSTLSFLRRNLPGYAVISCGAANDYGHPHTAVLHRLEELRAVVLRTDRNGEIVARTDGNRLVVRTEK